MEVGFTITVENKQSPCDQKKCLLRRGVGLWEVRNLVIVSGQDHDIVFLRRGVQPKLNRFIVQC